MIFYRDVFVHAFTIILPLLLSYRKNTHSTHNTIYHYQVQRGEDAFCGPYGFLRVIFILIHHEAIRRTPYLRIISRREFLGPRQIFSSIFSLQHIDRLPHLVKRKDSIDPSAQGSVSRSFSSCTSTTKLCGEVRTYGTTIRVTALTGGKTPGRTEAGVVCKCLHRHSHFLPGHFWPLVSATMKQNATSYQASG